LFSHSHSDFICPCDYIKVSDWQELELNKFLQLKLSKVKKPQQPYLRLGIRSHGKGIFTTIVDDPDSKFMYKPDFNNIKNGGVGLFASQYKLTIFGKALKREELDSLAWGRFTRKLNFADSRGNFPDGK